MSKIDIFYATRSRFKREEIEEITSNFSFKNENSDNELIKNRFNILFSDVKTDEPLEVDLETMVRHKALSAYRSLLMPCIVEHAGLILSEHESVGYPGGLTQPMMDALGPENFLLRTSAAGKKAIARAVIGYCDGMSVRVFVGETKGKIALEPKGDREFYWDTLFSPDEFNGKTYAEVSSDRNLGISEKMKISQSMKALRLFLEYRIRIKGGANDLFTDFGN